MEPVNQLVPYGGGECCKNILILTIYLEAWTAPFSYYDPNCFIYDFTDDYNCLMCNDYYYLDFCIDLVPTGDRCIAGCSRCK